MEITTIVKTTPAELIERWRWDEYCDIVGLNPWCVNEGLMDSDAVIEMSGDVAKSLGILLDGTW